MNRRRSQILPKSLRVGNFINWAVLSIFIISSVLAAAYIYHLHHKTASLKNQVAALQNRFGAMEHSREYVLENLESIKDDIHRIEAIQRQNDKALGEVTNAIKIITKKMAEKN